MLYLIANLMSEAIILSKLNMFYTHLRQKEMLADIVCSRNIVIQTNCNLVFCSPVYFFKGS
jgi:hypothetical protein